MTSSTNPSRSPGKGLRHSLLAACACATTLLASLSAQAAEQAAPLDPSKLTPQQQSQYASVLAIAAKSPAVGKALASGKVGPAAPGATDQPKAASGADSAGGCKTEPESPAAKSPQGTYVPPKYTSSVTLAQRLALAKKSPPSAKGAPNWSFVSVTGKAPTGAGKPAPALVLPVTTGLGANSSPLPSK